MRSRPILAALALVAVWSAAPLGAQSDRALDLTEAILDRFFTAHAKEKSEAGSVSTQLSDTEAKIAKFEQCKRDFEAAGSIAGGRLAQIAARAAIKSKCGATDSEGMRKERQRIMDGPETAAATAGGFKLPEYRNLRDRLHGYMAGDRSGFTKAGLDLLKSREGHLSAAFGIPVASAEGMGGMRGAGMRGAGMWNTDFTWVFVSQMFAVQYLSGATMFEKDYAPGEWTRWSVKTDDDDEKQTVERAFLGRTSDGGEWWRMKTITMNGKEADTVSFETLFKPEQGNEGMQKLLRMRAKLPGNPEPQEMMVPDQWSTWNMMGTFSSKPTPESVAGATVGTEEVKTPAGTFRAKHVKFGQGGGSLNWWLDDATIGGWVKFQAMDNGSSARYSMELVAKGTGAKSELGVEIK